MRVLAAMWALAVAAVPAAQAQTSYPTKPVRIVVGFAAGGPSDIVARLLAQQLTERLGRNVLVENRPEVAETMRRLRRTMWEAEMAMRKIRANPAFLLFGDDEQLLDSNPYDESELRRTGRARPYNQRDESNDGR